MNHLPMTVRNALIVSVIGHLLILLFFSVNLSHQRPVLVNESKNEPGQMLPVEKEVVQQPEIVKAVAVDNQEVNEAVNHLKAEREHQQQVERAHQQQLAKQAEAARQQRVKEEQRLAKLKDDADKIAIARKKQMEEEQKRLKQMTLEKEQAAKKLEAMKKEQADMQKKQQEAEKKLAAVQQKQAQDKLQKEKAALAAEAEAKRQAQAAHEAQVAAANQARIAGEVDKYKALIIDAISRQWILPDNTNRNLSSQFRIRLAPDGGVIEVSLLRSSGDPILDRSAQTAIYKASPLPVPTDVTTFNLFREISLTVRPENVRG